MGGIPSHMTSCQGNLQSLWRTGLGRAVVIATSKGVAKGVSSRVGGKEEESLRA